MTQANGVQNSSQDALNESEFERLVDATGELPSEYEVETIFWWASITAIDAVANTYTPALVQSEGYVFVVIVASLTVTQLLLN